VQIEKGEVEIGGEFYYRCSLKIGEVKNKGEF